MKTLKAHFFTFSKTKPTLRNAFLAFLLLFIFSGSSLKAQSFCSTPIDLTQGFSVSIYSVTENPDGTHNIKIQVSHNGGSEPGWSGLNHFSVQAEAGSYSDIVFTNI